VQAKQKHEEVEVLEYVCLKSVMQNTPYLTVAQCAGKAEARGLRFWSMFVKSQLCRTRFKMLWRKCRQSRSTRLKCVCQELPQRFTQCCSAA